MSDLNLLVLLISLLIHYAWVNLLILLKNYEYLERLAKHLLVLLILQKIEKD